MGLISYQGLSGFSPLALLCASSICIDTGSFTHLYILWNVIDAAWIMKICEHVLTTPSHLRIQRWKLMHRDHLADMWTGYSHVQGSPVVGVSSHLWCVSNMHTCWMWRTCSRCAFSSHVVLAKKALVCNVWCSWWISRQIFHFYSLNVCKVKLYQVVARHFWPFRKKYFSSAESLAAI